MTDPLSAAVIAGLTGIISDIIKDKAGNLLKQADIDILKKELSAKASPQYIQKYQERHGRVKILGMSRPVSVESIYTSVRFLGETSQGINLSSLEEIQEDYMQRSERRFQMRRVDNQDGVTVANENQYLAVVGQPGAGKTTFLRNLGLEALKGECGAYKHKCIPVLIELKQFKAWQVNLFEAISEEIKLFNYDLPNDFVENALKKGKLLILLDGLDEVPKIRMNRVVNEIQNFVDRYDANRYVLSCRVAAYRSTFSRFMDVELADFNDEQIKNFIERWFFSDNNKQSNVADRCWIELTHPSNRAAKELAQTPLLLTFLCLVYDRKMSFPPNRARLFRKALDILLEDWAAEKRMFQPGEIFESFNIDLERIILSEIAHEGLLNEQIFFIEEELIKHIDEFLFKIVTSSKKPSGRDILNAVVEQQGILVQRAENLFSFSHLTLQEFLTAQLISQDYREIQKLIDAKLTEARWQEVFLLVSGLIRNSDEMLQIIERKSTQYICNLPKIHNLFTWLDQTVLSQQSRRSVAVQRCAVLYFAVTGSLQFSSKSYASSSVSKALISLLKTFDQQLARSLNRAIRYAFTPDTSRNHGRDIDRDLPDSFSDEFEQIAILRNVNFSLFIARLKYSYTNIVLDEDTKRRQESILKIRRLWFDSLQISPALVTFTDEEAQLFNQYLYGNELLVKCKEAAATVSESTWQRIIQHTLTFQCN